MICVASTCIMVVQHWDKLTSRPIRTAVLHQHLSGGKVTWGRLRVIITMGLVSEKHRNLLFLSDHSIKNSWYAGYTKLLARCWQQVPDIHYHSAPLVRLQWMHGVEQLDSLCKTKLSMHIIMNTKGWMVLLTSLYPVLFKNVSIF